MAWGRPWPLDTAGVVHVTEVPFPREVQGTGKMSASMWVTTVQAPNTRTAATVNLAVSARAGQSVSYHDSQIEAGWSPSRIAR